MAAIPPEAHAAGANSSPSNPWITQNPGPAAFPVGPIAASNGARVALGRRTLVVSTDGKTWRETEIEARGIASGNGVFVAITKDQLMSSANGSDWKKTADAVGSTVAFGNGRFVVAGPSGVVVTSSDGLKWSPPSHGGAGDVALLVFGKGRFVAVLDGKKPHLVASQDGVHWSVVRRFESRSEQALLFGNGVFVHANDDGVFTSRDGLRWAAVGNAGMIAAQRMFYAGDRFVGLIAKDDRVSNLCASRDLESWTSVGPVLPLVRRMGFDDGRFYASDDDGVVYGSTDLTRWEAMNTASTQRLNAVACGNGWLVAVGDDGTIPRSQDATHWTAIAPITTSRLDTVTYWKFDLDERTKDGKQTGRFRGKLMGHELVGQWSAPDGSQVLYVDGYQSSLEDIAAKQAAFKTAFKDAAGKYELTMYNDYEGANTMYDCGMEGEKWVCSASCIEQGMREAFDWEVPGFLDGSYRIEIDHGLTISLLVDGRRLRTIPVEENPMVYFPANGTLAKNVPLKDLAAEESAGRYALECSSDLKIFTLRGHAMLTFAKARRR